MAKFLRMNWGIYEQDIEFLGGTVTYIGNIISKSRRSTIEEAIVTAGNASCNVLMERFADGSAVIKHFVKLGLIYEKELYPEAKAFWYQFHSLAEDNLQFMSFDFMRRCKQYLTVALQFASILAFFFALYCSVFKSFSIIMVTLLITSLLVFFILSTFYSWYRTCKISDHKIK